MYRAATVIQSYQRQQAMLPTPTHRLQVNRIVPSWGRLRSILARHVYAGEDNDVAADAELADEDIAVVDDAVDERHDDDVAVDEAADVTVKEVHDDSMDAAEGYSAAFPVGEASLIAAAGGMSQLAAAYGDEQFTKTQPVQPVLDLVDNDSDLDADDDATAVRSASSMTRTTAGKRRRTGGRSVRRGVTLRALLASVLSSEAELRAALDREGALELPRGSGRYRAVDPDFNLAVLDAALMEASAAAAEDGRLSADGGSGAPSWLVDMDTAAIAARLQDRFPVDVTRHVLRTFSVDRSRKSEVEGPEDARATLSFNAVARAKALQLLRQRDTGNGVAMDSFMAAWHRSLGRDVLRLAPADAVARSSMAQSAIASILAGYVLVDDAAGTGGALGRAASQPAVRMFNHELLPEDAAARFKTLFAVRPRWRLGESRQRP